MQKVIKSILIFILLIISNLTLFGQAKNSDFTQTISIEQEENISINSTSEAEKSNPERKRNHTISVEASSYNLWYPVGLNYDVNLYRKNDFLLGGTVSVGLISAKAGAYAGFRQSWGDMFKAEVGMDLTAGWGDGFIGPYGEIAYRSQRDDRWFFWEVAGGYIYNTFEPNVTEVGLPYASVAIGVSF
jgi:hypothetical protein